MGTIIQKLDKTLETKAAIRQAIIGKGQAVEDTDPFESYPEKIGAIQTGVQLPELSNPGTAADLLAGKQLVDQYGNPLTGTMPQRSAANLTASGAAVTVPAGYYPSQVSKSVATATHPKPTISRSGGTITAKHVQSAGYTSGGTTTETLSIPTQAAKTVTPTTYAQTAVSSGRLTTGAVTVAGDANLTAGNIRSGVSIFGVAGSAESRQYDLVRIYNQTAYQLDVIISTNTTDDNIQRNVVGIMAGQSAMVQIPHNVWCFIDYSGSEGIFAENISSDKLDFLCGGSTRDMTTYVRYRRNRDIVTNSVIIFAVSGSYTGAQESFTVVEAVLAT